jgi:hypothetical protein
VRLRLGLAGGALLRAPRRRTPGIDVGAYGKAFVLLARNPSLILAPLLMGFASVLVGLVLPSGGPLGGLNAGIGQFISFMLAAFGLSVALIQADAAWRYGRAPFDAAWEESRRKLPEILMAAIGFNFVLFVALYAGNFLGEVGTILIGLVAIFFFIYTLPAAAIGGVPGGAALQVALERARAAPVSTAAVVVVSMLAYGVIPTIVTATLLPLVISLGIYSSALAQMVGALVQSVAAAYVALALSKAYNDIAYRGW